MQIPLEYFDSVLQWLATRERINPEAMGVTGWARGCELALLLGTTFPAVKAVVAFVPSGAMWGTGRRLSATGGAYSLDAGRQDAAFSPIPGRCCRVRQLPYSLTPGFLASLRDCNAVEQATIPVERTAGPILLFSGQDDKMWPSTVLAEIVTSRLKQHGFGFMVEHLSYPEAGHLIGIPYGPTTIAHAHHPVVGSDFTFGGTAAANAFACADSWPKVLGFLRRYLKQSAGMN